MTIKKVASIILFTAVAINFGGCIDYDSSVSLNADPTTTFQFEALLYDNMGNNYVTFKGNSFDITPNKVEQWGYDTDGSWISWYETSSVVSIKIDGNYVQTCGSSVIFKDSRLEIMPLEEDIGVVGSSDESGYSVDVSDNGLINYFALTNWWYDTHENGQGGEKIALIQSQDGYNIGIVEGNDVTWEVAEKLPKTTLVTVDGMSLYIHRCNFTIIDTALFEKAVKE